MRKLNHNKISTFLHISICYMIFIFTLLLFTSNAFASTGVTIKGSIVNVRSGPGENYKIVETVKKGSTYKLIKSSKGWYNITLSSKKNGWVKGNLAALVNQRTDTTNKNNKKLIITGSNVNIRSGPGINFKVLTSLNNGTVLPFLKLSNGWYNIILPNKQNGWVANNYVKEIKSDSDKLPDDSQSNNNNNNSTTKKVAIIVNKANIRKGPNTNYNIIAYGLKGETYPLLSTSNGWHNIQLKNNQKGWVSANIAEIVSGSEIVSEDAIVTQDYIQVVLPKDKKTMSYSAKTLQDPYRLVVTVNNVQPDCISPPDIDVDSPLVSKIEVAVDPVKRTSVTYTYYLAQPIHYTVYSTPGDKIGANKIASDTDTYDKKVTIKISPLTLIGKKIVIDPGHGGRYPDPRADSGAVARDKSGKIIYKEKDFNLSVALLVATRLQELGAEVILTRSTDVYVPLYDRTRIANQAEADIFISIHANSGSSSTVGTETIKNTCSNSTKPFLKSQKVLRNMLAEAIQTNVVSKIGTKNRGYYEDVRGLAVLRTSRMPSILVEVGFLSNSTEVKKLMSSDFQNKAADGIVAGINKYFTTAK